jgi:phosphate:Na+ symporter
MEIQEKIKMLVKEHPEKAMYLFEDWFDRMPEQAEEEIDNMRRDLVAEHIVRLGQGKCRPENNTIFINLVCNLERVGDHLNFIVHNCDN